MSSNNSTIKIRADQFSRLITAFPEFRYLGDPILRTPCAEVSVPEGIEIGKQLEEVLIKYRGIVGYGRGLAAPQIGIASAVFVTYLNDQVQTYINPKIIKSSDAKNLYRELCLSTGIVWGDIARSVTITMQWTDIAGRLQEQEATDTLARLWQHEEAHLRGLPSIDQAVTGTIELCLSDPLQEKLRPA
ncbi:MAG: peptide deformylase [Patescibacteria group bacterium]